MKKNLLFLAALSVVALPFLFSCGKPDDPDKPAEVIVMQDPPTKDAAKLVIFPSDNLPKFVATDSGKKYGISKIEFTEASRYVMKCELDTKAGDGETFIGNYTENNGTYNCQGFGSVKVSGSGSNTKVEVKPDGEVNKDNGYSGNANVQDTPEGSNQEQKNVIRNWSISDILLNVVGTGVKIERGFTGCNLQAIADYAAKNGVKSLDPTKFDGYTVKEFSFTGNGTFIISFTEPQKAPAIAGTYTVNNSAKTISLSLPEGNAFFHGKINGTFEFPADKKMTLNLELKDIKGYSGSMTLNLVQN